MGPCNCGDLFCHSCGPLQGNDRCVICGKWTSEGGCDDREACDAAVAKLDADFAEALEQHEPEAK